MRVGPYEVDLASARALGFLLRQAYVPRSRREAAFLRPYAAAARFGFVLPPMGLAPAAAEAENAPPPEAVVEAARSMLRAAGCEPAIESGLSAAEGSRRTAYLWRAGDQNPWATVRAAPVADGGRELLRAAEGVERVRALAPEPAMASPRVLAAETHGELAVTVEERPEGVSLGRVHLLRRRAGSWNTETLASVGAWVGSLHAATWRKGATAESVSCAVHGGLGPSAVTVTAARDGAPGSLTAVLDWSAFREDGDPFEEVLGFLVACADGDLSARGPRAAATRESADALARWLLLPGSPAFPAATAFLAAWRVAAAPMLRDLKTTEQLFARVVPAVELGRRDPISPLTADGLHVFLAGPGPFAARSRVKDRRLRVRRFDVP